MILGLDPLTIASFVGAGVVLNLTPGVDVMFASASGIAGGPRAGIAAAAGISLGALVFTGIAAAGLAVLLQANPAAFDVVRYLGAAYLLFLAVKSWRAGPAERMTGAPQLSRAFPRGILNTLLNPKVALFIFAFLPQFTVPDAGPVWAQILFLGALFSVTGFAITASYGVAAGLAGQALGRRSGWLGKLAAGVFAALALRLVLD